jgi:hypothetical protein
LDGHRTGSWCSKYRRTKRTIEAEENATVQMVADSVVLFAALARSRRIA